jgi:hypothetical protein
MTDEKNVTKSTHKSMTDHSRGRSTVTRRLAMNMIASSGAFVPASLVSAAPGGADPIFAVIDAHRKAYAALDSCLTRHGDIEQQLADAVDHLRHDRMERYRELKALQAATPEWVALEQEVEDLHRAEQDATIGLIEVRPATLAGAGALMRYVVEQERLGNEWPGGLEDTETGFDNEDWATFLHRNIAEVIEAAAQA